MKYPLIYKAPIYEEAADERPSFELRLPKTWSDLNERQLQYVLQLQTTEMSPFEIRVAALLRFSGLEERAPRTDAEKALHAQGHHFMRLPYASSKREIVLPDWFIAESVASLVWMEHPSEDVTRLRHIAKKHRPVDAQFQDLPFGDYLSIENLWQSTISWAMVIKSVGENERDKSRAKELTEQANASIGKIMEQIARILYRPEERGSIHVTFPVDTKIRLGLIPKAFRMSELMAKNIVHWMTGFHLFAIKQWPHLFKEGDPDAPAVTVTPQLLRETVDVQINALTGGDVTKVKEVYEIDTWSALNMLDIKAKEAEMARKEHEKAMAEAKSKRT